MESFGVSTGAGAEGGTELKETDEWTLARRSLLQSFLLAMLPGEAGARSPLYFSASDYVLLNRLCQFIIPSENDKSGGAIEAQVPVFIDLLTSENPDYQRRLSGGFAWLNAYCDERFGAAFLNCTEAQQRDVLDKIAFRSSALHDDLLLPGTEFFAFLRDFVLDGFFTSQIGIDYLEFRGNKAVARFDGCPVPTPNLARP
jgi:hypothetical protein